MTAFVMYALLVASISYVIADSEIAIPFRAMLRKIWPFAGRALSCHVCTCYWVSLVICATVPLEPLFWWLPWFWQYVCDVATIAFAAGVIGAAFKRLALSKENYY